MQNSIKLAIDKLKKLPKDKPIKVISHNDTDGITSAAIFSKALQRWEKRYTLEIVKGLHRDYIKNLPESHILIFLDLASGSLPYLAEKQTEIFIFDHHEITKEIPANVTMVNPVLEKEENICGAAIAYLFAKTLSNENLDLSHLAVIGMVGDMHESNLNKTYSQILNDAEVTIKKGLLLYPATRPLDRVLENSFGVYIPGVTGSFKGVLEMLREVGIPKGPRGFKSLAELTEEEMSKLTTSILLKTSESPEKESKLVGNIYLVKLFNHIEDAREISALINACSRMDHPHIALGFCLGNKSLKKESQRIYTKYRKAISATLGQIDEFQKIQGDGYQIINGEDKIKDTIVGTVTSIMSFSSTYEKGTILITMANTENEKIKISGRIAGRNGRNVREILNDAVTHLPNSEIGGHPMAAGAVIQREDAQIFIENLQNILEVNKIKAQQ